MPVAKAELLSERFAIIAVDRTPKSVETFREYLAEGVRDFVSDTASGPANEPFDRRAWEFVESRIIHFTARNLPCGQRRPLGRRCPAVAQPPPMAAANVTAAPYSTLAR
jgi:hypothetical protein